MKTIPLDTRTRILLRYDSGKFTRSEVAEQFMVSEDFVKKLLKQRKRLGHVRPLHDRVGRKRVVTGERAEQMALIIRRKPGVTLEELRAEIGGIRAVSTIHVALRRMRITYKKKRYELPSRTAGTCARRAKSGRR